MSFVLFIKGLKSSAKLILVFLALITLYGTMVVYMYDPQMSESLQDMVNSMPQMFAAFNMGEIGTNLLEFISNYLYGFLFVACPLVFISILSLKLVCNYVDSTSMAYLLATPNTRKKIIVTQAMVLISSVMILLLYIMFVIWATKAVVFPSEELGIEFINLNLGLLGLLVCFSGICFCASCVFSHKSYAAGMGAGVCTFFLLCDMLHNVNEEIEFLKYLTPLTLFDTAKIIGNDENVIYNILSLYIIGIVFIIIGSCVFCKKDLHV